MYLILKRISETTRIPDIERFLKPALAQGMFTKGGYVESLTIKMIQSRDSDVAEYHAIVNIQPDAVAKRVAKTLNRKRCHGKPINVAIYRFRYRHEDRRSILDEVRLQNLRKGERRRPHWKSPKFDDKQGHDLRKRERRRANLQVTDVTMKRNGYRANNGVADVSWNIGFNVLGSSFMI